MTMAKCVFILYIFLSLYALLLADSGTKLGNQILPGDYPWHVSILTKNYHYLCNGAIIGDEWIVTTADCVEQKLPEQIGVVYGQQLYSGRDRGSLKLHHVEQVITNERFIRETREYDIALLKLSTTITFDNYTAAARIPFPGQLPSGTCKLSTSITSEREVQSSVDISTFYECEEVFSGQLQVRPHMFCARLHSDLPNMVSSGAPLICSDKSGNNYLAGISILQSDGHCLFSRISYHSLWMAQYKVYGDLSSALLYTIITIILTISLSILACFRKYS